jgi:aminopeptidase N
MGQDSLHTTHPIVQDVRTVEQANQAFDAITYSKGESVLSMLETYATPETWQRGIQAYIRAHEYQNTRTDDLWRAVEGAGAKGLTQIAHDFTLQPGVPLIRVGAVTCDAGQSRVTLLQDEFSADRKAGSFTPLSWHVPVRIAVVGAQPVTVVTSGRETQVSVPGCGPILANAGQAGYYRTLYPAASAEQLRSDFARIDPVDEFGLVADQLALSRSGYQPMGIGLDFAAAIPSSAPPELLSLGVGVWTGLYRLFDGDSATQQQIAALVEQRYAPVLTQIGLTPTPGEKPTVATLRPQLIEALGLVGDPQVNAEARRSFDALQTNPAAVPGGLKQTWLGIVAANADATTWEQLHAMARNALSATERQNLYSLLGAAKSDALAQRALDLAITDEPGKTVSAGMIGAVAREHPDLALDFVLSHWPQVEKFIDLSARSRFIGRLASGSHNADTIAKLQAYADANIAASDRKPIDQAITVIRVRLATEQRTKSETVEWLRSRGGAAPQAIPASAPQPERG